MNPLARKGGRFGKPESKEIERWTATSNYDEHAKRFDQSGFHGPQRRLLRCCAVLGSGGGRKTDGLQDEPRLKRGFSRALSACIDLVSSLV
jgi:hypothetical protein